MTGLLRFPIEIKDTPAQNQKSITIHIDSRSNLPWCLELCLLERDLNETLTVSDESESVKLEIRKDSSSHCPPPGRVRWFSGGVEITICREELEYWLAFFLKYYRDGAASVDHIDIGIPPRQSNTSTGLFLTFKVPDVLPGLTYEELRRHLGLP